MTTTSTPHPPAALILASASPRRRELLGRVGVPLEVDAADIDETQAPAESATLYAARVARAKAETVAARKPGRWILAADTVVIVDGESLGKPADAADARAMIARLQGRTHDVVTATCLIAPGPLGHAPLERTVTTKVHLRVLGAAEIDAYVASGEWHGKAGGYAIQGIGSGIVSGIGGSYTNVVGLPLAEVIEDLTRHAHEGAPVARMDHGQPA